MYLRLLLLPIIFTLVACDTDTELNKQRIDAVDRERTMLLALSESLKRGDYKTDEAIVSAFISGRVINSALESLNGTKIDLPGTFGAVLTVKKIVTNFRTGFPEVSVDATVERLGIVAAASLFATIDAETDNQPDGELFLKIRVDSLIPRLSWGHST